MFRSQASEEDDSMPASLRMMLMSVVIVGWNHVVPHRAEADEPVFELRTYTCEEGRLEALHARFRDHTMELFEKHGITNLAYWTPTDAETSKTTLIYLIRHDSREAAARSWQAFREDPEWQRVRAASEEDGRILARAPESLSLSAADYSPEIGTADPDKVYEVRVYTAAEGKLDDLHARFREHTDEIFKNHGMIAYAYWRPLEAPASENQLVYILAHASREAANDSWQAFARDPEWQEARAASELNGKLVERVGRTYMTVTDFSPE
jgi:hypothetical protein